MEPDRSVEKASYAASGFLCIAQSRGWHIEANDSLTGLTLRQTNNDHHPCRPPGPSHAPASYSPDQRTMFNVVAGSRYRTSHASAFPIANKIGLWNHDAFSHYQHTPESSRPQNLRVLCTSSRKGETIYITPDDIGRGTASPSISRQRGKIDYTEPWQCQMSSHAGARARAQRQKSVACRSRSYLVFVASPTGLENADTSTE